MGKPLRTRFCRYPDGTWYIKPKGAQDYCRVPFGIGPLTRKQVIRLATLQVDEFLEELGRMHRDKLDEPHET